MKLRRIFRQRLHGKKRYILVWFCVLLAIAWSLGFIIFVGAIPTTPATESSKTEAIVVLTGGSLRLEAGLALLSAGRAKKLLVSGVHRGVDVAELLRVSRQSPKALDCCIALGYTADNTLGNARETAQWMKRERFTSLRLVTANYHMPRSLLEFRSAMPGVVIIPHPVSPAHVKLGEWWLWPGTAILLVSEYSKYLLAGARRSVRFLINPGGERTL